MPTTRRWREAHAPHRAFYRAFSDLKATSMQFFEDARAAVRLPTRDKDLTDDLAEFRVGLDASTRRTLRVRVVALPSDVEEAAHRRERERRLLRVDESEPHSLSFAKKAAAFFRIARSISSSAFLLRSFAFSSFRRAISCSGDSCTGDSASVARFRETAGDRAGFFRLAMSILYQYVSVAGGTPRSKARPLALRSP